MTGEIVVSVIAASAAIMVAALAYYQAKRVKFFEMYFDKKATAYEKCLHSFSAVRKNPDQFDEMIRAIRAAMLYCPEETRELLIDMMDMQIEIHEAKCAGITEHEDDLKSLVTMREKMDLQLRKDLENCRKFKFSDS